MTTKIPQDDDYYIDDGMFPNKIPQEIEKKILKELWKEHIKKYPYTDAFYLDEVEQAISLAFKAGQKQTNEEELEFLMEFRSRRDGFNFHQRAVLDKKIIELKSKLTREKREDTSYLGGYAEYVGEGEQGK